MSVARGTRVEGGSSLGAKILQLLRVLKRYLMQGHHTLITGCAKVQGQPQTAQHFDPAVSITQNPFGELQTPRSKLIGHIDSGEGLAQEPNLGHLHRTSPLYGLEHVPHLPLYLDDSLSPTANLYALDL